MLASVTFGGAKRDCTTNFSVRGLIVAGREGATRHWVSRAAPIALPLQNGQAR